MNEQNEAVIVLCKCAEVHKTYGIRTERQSGDRWSFTWAFPIKEDSARREGYDKSFVKGVITYEENYPGCPYCGGRKWVVCSCGHLNCSVMKNGIFTCEWCGAQGMIGLYTGEAIAAGMDR